MQPYRSRSPAEDRAPILLPGKSENPVAETWSNIQGPHAPWFTGTFLSLASPLIPEPALIVVPGGGTVVLQMQREGYTVARWLNQHQ